MEKVGTRWGWQVVPGRRFWTKVVALGCTRALRAGYAKFKACFQAKNTNRKKFPHSALQNKAKAGRETERERESESEKTKPKNEFPVLPTFCGLVAAGTCNTHTHTLKQRKSYAYFALHKMQAALPNFSSSLLSAPPTLTQRYSSALNASHKFIQYGNTGHKFSAIDLLGNPTTQKKKY